jgi:putative tryptophan/tyrosine transport system substrate-binding protein
MKRREFVTAICSAALSWPLTALAQQPSKVPRVGVLSPGHPPPRDPFRQAELFEAGLRELGLQPGKTIQIEYRYAEGQLQKLPEMAAELVRLPVDVIVARGQTIAAARDATSTIGIVMAADPDPVGNGFVKSLARPGGNITGFSTQAFELEAKQLELLREAMPALRAVGVLTSGRAAPVSAELIERRRAAGRTLNIRLTDVAVSDSAELGNALSKMTAAGAEAVLISGTLWFVDASMLARLAVEQRLATIGNLREFAHAGALMTYGVSFADIHRRSAVFVDKIIKGAAPAEMPVEQPTKFDLVVNLKTAKALGVSITPILVAQADEVIE